MKKLYNIKLLINCFLFLFITALASCDSNNHSRSQNDDYEYDDDYDDDDYDDDYDDYDDYDDENYSDDYNDDGYEHIHYQGDNEVLYEAEVYNTYLDKNAPYLNLRSEPNGESKLLASYVDGTRLYVIEKGLGSKGLWLRVFAEHDHEIGYVHSRWVKFIGY